MQTCYKMKVNSYLCYHTYCKSERQKARCEEGGVQARAKENVSGDQESTEHALQFFLYARITNQTKSLHSGVWEPSSRESVQKLQTLEYERWGQVDIHPYNAIHDTLWFEHSVLPQNPGSFDHLWRAMNCLILDNCRREWFQEKGNCVFKWPSESLYLLTKLNTVAWPEKNHSSELALQSSWRFDRQQY